MAFVHVFISLFALITVSMYTIETAVNDVSIVINVVVLIFVTEFDEKMFEIYKAARAFNKDSKGGRLVQKLSVGGGSLRLPSKLKPGMVCCC